MIKRISELQKSEGINALVNINDLYLLEKERIIEDPTRWNIGG